MLPLTVLVILCLVSSCWRLLWIINTNPDQGHNLSLCCHLWLQRSCPTKAHAADPGRDSRGRSWSFQKKSKIPRVKGWPRAAISMLRNSFFFPAWEKYLNFISMTYSVCWRQGRQSISLQCCFQQKSCPHLRTSWVLLMLNHVKSSSSPSHPMTDLCRNPSILCLSYL